MSELNKHLSKIIYGHVKELGAKEISKVEDIQELWSGYGMIQRLHLVEASIPSLILKKIQPPAQEKHPKGWNTKTAHQRKMKSYQVEANWYANYNYEDALARVPKIYAAPDSEGCILMEDLNATGYPRRIQKAAWPEIKVCIRWLANFHARFLNIEPEGLWKTGSYWHLETRPEEWEKIKNNRLKATASLIDKKLNNAKYQTIIHGDAKLANFCFSKDLKQVAAVDFQYVGGGCGMKDLCYFMSGALDSQNCYKREEEILKVYFDELRNAIKKRQEKIDFQELETEWRSLYTFAWADFYRFLVGWSPGHFKINAYSSELAENAVQEILKEFSQIAENAAKAAGKIIKRESNKNHTVQKKDAPSLSSSVVTDVDFKAQEEILKLLRPSIKAFDLGLLTEELQDDQSRLSKNYFWCVDPLDGTLPFSEKLPGYAVSIALVEKSGASIVGAVYDPVKSNLYSATLEGGAYKNKKSLLKRTPPTRKKIRLYADRSLRNHPGFAKISENFEVITKGGAVMNSIWCLENPPACYFKFPSPKKGGVSLWDMAAVALIVKEAGGVASDFKGQDIELNRVESTYLNHQGICIVSDCLTAQEISKQGLIDEGYYPLF